MLQVPSPAGSRRTDWALPVSLKGRAYTRLYLVFARPALKAVLAGLPKPLRRFIASRYLG
jgi:hypothetical protein